MFINGRLPFVGDDPPAYAYQGWLLPYVQGAPCEAGARWRWYLDVGSEKHCPAEIAIPRLHFSDAPSATGIKQIEKAVEILDYKEGAWNGMRLFVDWLAYALNVDKERAKLDAKNDEALYRQFNLEPLLREPHDYLGAVIAERKGSGWNPFAFYPTPHCICEMMTLMQCAGTRPEHTVNDPAVGTARLLLHASNYSLRLYGTDIDAMMVKAAKINGALYAPWLSFPLPETYWQHEKLELPAPRVISLQPERVNKKGQGLLFA